MDSNMGTVDELSSMGNDVQIILVSPVDAAALEYDLAAAREQERPRLHAPHAAARRTPRARRRTPHALRAPPLPK